MIIRSKIAGVTFDNRQEYVKELAIGQMLFWKHEEDNPYDSNAIALFADADCLKKIGHLSKDVAQVVVQELKNGQMMTIWCENVTGLDKPTKGVNIRVLTGGKE